MIRSIKPTLLLCVLLISVLVAACAPASTPEPTAVPPTPTPLQLPAVSSATSAPATSAPSAQSSSTTGGGVTGASLFELSCASCHAADGAGNTFTKDGQTITTPSLHWTDLTQTYSKNPSRGSVADQVVLSIVKGQDETGSDLNAMMPRWSSLSQAQVDSLVQYLQTIGTTTGPAPTLTSDAMNLQGEQLYQAACAACHGADGAGNTFTKDGQTITTPSLHWADLTQTYSKNPSRGSVADQVALSIVKGQDETGSDLNAMMPRWSSLSQAQVDSLAQYLQTTFK